MCCYFWPIFRRTLRTLHHYILRSVDGHQHRLTQVLHVRSFLDHDRPYLPATRPVDSLVEQALNASSDAVYVDNDRGGVLLRPADAFFSLVEHWERWAACLGKHGLLLLEVSNLDVASTGRYKTEAVSMHFDALQAHSGQLLTPAAHMSMAAAHAGLLPHGDVLTYPKDATYARIVLQQLCPAQLSIRLATPNDVPQLLELEVHWKSAALAASEATLRRRIAAHPAGQFAARSEDGALVGVLYTQRVVSHEALRGASVASELDLHVADGGTVQLLGLVTRPGSRVGARLRDFALLLARLDATVDRVCGATRCRGYAASSGQQYDAYVAEAADPGLRFHCAAGARLCEVLPDYRPRDVANLGNGVLICYELHAAGRDHGSPQPTPLDAASAPVALAARSAPPMPASSLASWEELVCEAVRGLTYAIKPRWTGMESHTPFMELGVDSLDAQLLVRRLSEQLPTRLPSTAIFDHPTPRRLAAHVQLVHDGRVEARVPHERRLDATPTRAPRAACIGGASVAAPDGAQHARALWNVGVSARDAVGEVPVSRWDARRLAAEVSLPTSTRMRHGGFVHAVDLFDSIAFAISPAEAAAMDPQQRLLLEHGYTALRDGGSRRASLLDSLVGVFLGVMHSDFAWLCAAAPAGGGPTQLWPCRMMHSRADTLSSPCCLRS